MTEKQELALLIYFQANAVLGCVCGQQVELSSNDDTAECSICGRRYSLAWAVFQAIAEGGKERRCLALR